ncbi:MAG: hypothetical protein EON52_20110 [Actinomycetales bacterium]|nr:MAG: hypothetical protein EON52_20110 [Actinomycetales bacterium]
MSTPQPPPQPPPQQTKYRPSAGWFVGGIALILLAVVAGIGIFVWLLSGFLSSDATLRADGAPHRVSVGTDGDRVLWFEDIDTQCDITDLESGDPVELRTMGGSLERSDPEGDLAGLYRFSPGSGDLEVTCFSPFSEMGEGGVVLIGPMPQIDNIVLGVLLVIGVPGLLGLAGLVMLIWTGVLWSLRDARPKRT